MSVIERIKVKIQKLKQRINELKCQVISKHQVIQTLMSQMVMVNSLTLLRREELVEDIQTLIDNDTDKVRELKKKIAKKQKLLSELEEYLTLHYKQLEVNSYKSNGFDEKLTCMYIDSKILDRMKELELKIDKPKLFKRDDVSPRPCL